MPAYDQRIASTWHQKTAPAHNASWHASKCQRQRKCQQRQQAQAPSSATASTSASGASASACCVLSVTATRNRGFSELFSSRVSSLSAHVLSAYHTKTNKTLNNSGLARARVPYIAYTGARLDSSPCNKIKASYEIAGRIVTRHCPLKKYMYVFWIVMKLFRWLRLNSRWL